jgi:hypothetical protein
MFFLSYGMSESVRESQKPKNRVRILRLYKIPTKQNELSCFRSFTIAGYFSCGVASHNYSVRLVVGLVPLCYRDRDFF